MNDTIEENTDGILDTCERLQVQKSNSLNSKGSENVEVRKRSLSSRTSEPELGVHNMPRTPSFDSKSSPKSRRAKQTPSSRTRHLKRQDSKGRNDLSYELSADLKAITLDMLEKKYGGKLRANKAARTIQEYYRHWVFSRGFKRVRAFSQKRGKRSSVIRLANRNRESIKKLFEDESEVPVLIIDMKGDEDSDIISSIQNENGKIENNCGEIKKDGVGINEDTTAMSVQVTEEKTISENDKTILSDNDIQATGKKMIFKTNNSLFFTGEPKEKIESEQLQGREARCETGKEENGLKEGHEVKEDEGINGDQELKEDRDLKEEKEVKEDLEEKEKAEIKCENGEDTVRKHPPLSRVTSTDSYEIIDENQVLQVIGKVPKRMPEEFIDDGSNVSYDKVGSDSDSSSLNNDSIFYQDHSTYQTSVDKSKRWRFRIGINLFNSKPEDGIDYLIDNKLLESDPKSIAEFMRRETSISKQKISEFFGNLRKVLNMQVLEAFANSFDFTNKEIDEGLRQFQAYFKLTGEAQSVEKFLQVFSKRYVECNPGRLSKNPDTILLMAFAIAMLNTDLHNNNVKRKMDVEGFIRNLRGTDDGNNLPEDLLRGIYQRIQRNQLSTGADHLTQLQQIESSFIGKTPTIAEAHRQFVKLFTIEEVNDPNRKEKPHSRLAFLFNDMLLLTKPRGKAGQFGSGHIFSFKSSYKLLGTQVAEFSNEHYPFGVYLQTRLDQKTLGCFCAKDEKLRKIFVDELDDCIRETNGMENIRIALSKAKQLPRHGYQDMPKSFTLDRKTKYKKSTDTMSLINVNVNNSSLEAEDITGNMKERASSMLNINESTSDTESDPGLRRVNSSTSLEAAFMDNSRTFPRQTTTARSPSVRKMFQFPGRRRKQSNEKLTPPRNRKDVGMSRFFSEVESIGETES